MNPSQNPLDASEQTIFDAARQIQDVQARSTYVRQACEGHPELRDRIEKLLRAGERADEFLASDPLALGEAARQTLLVAPVTEGPGTLIGHYKLLEKLGEGGFGVVYMAEQKQPIKRRVALKIIKVGMDTREVVARFEAERQALALMDHPNIAKVFDAGATETGRPYFVMELVRGVKITEYCDEKKLSTRARLDLFTQVCQAVQHAHQKGIIHRDLKPSNILVTVNDGVAVPKVIDFGIAKATELELTEKTVFTRFHQFLGTPAYMSPEQMELTSVDIDTRSDLYSLGVLLYELLTGKTPFDANELLKAGLDEMRRTIREREPARPSTRVSTLGVEELTTAAKRRGLDPPKLVNVLRGDLDWIVMKCLEKDRARRYETATGLASDVQRHLSNEPVVACPPSNLYKFQKLVRRNKLAFAAGAGITAALVIGLAIALWQSVEKSRAYKQIRIEAARSQQVAQFLKDMLQGVGPSAALGRDTTLLREILERTSERVRKDLKDQPLVQAELLSIIGRVYFELDDYGKAEEIHREALILRQQVLGDEHADVASSLHDLGVAIRRENKAEGAPLIRQALAIRKKLFGDEHLDVAESLAWLGRAEEALAIQRKLLGEENPVVANTMRGLALDLSKRNPVEAEILSRKGLEIERKLFGEPHPAVAESLRFLALILQNAGKLEEAERIFHQSLEMKEKLNGADSWTYAITLRHLGQLLARQGPGRLAEAETAFRDAVALFRKLAARGGANPENRLAETMNMLGGLLERRGKVSEAEEVFRETLPLMREAAGRGFALAQDELGSMYVLGRGVPKDEAEGIRWYRKAAAQGYAGAQFNLGLEYARGTAVAKDLAEAAQWYRKAAEQGFAAAQHNLGSMYQHGEAVAKNAGEAVKWYRRAAEQGDAEAQNNLGAMYQRGEGVARDPVEAVSWYRKAAEQGGAAGQNNLGWTYQNGEGVAKNAAEAVKWYRKAAEQGYAAGQNNLGWMYQNGKGVAKNAAEAVKWYRKAADQGYALAQANLGEMYQRGESVAHDPIEAASWFRKAANQGDAVAQANLGKMYSKGEGVAKDLTEALNWFRKAAESGEAEALNDVAWFLAVCNDPKIRNGRSAVSFAEKAVTATNRKEPGLLDTLAAAYAEVGEFEKAVATQKEAMALLRTEQEKQDYASRLKLYESGSPYRESE
jgi:TPR repeat protein/serine/threonine protein kinase